MCTVSWAGRADGYDVFCNRDELTSRKPAIPPGVKAIEGVRYIAPVDGDFGGSWIAVNEFGLTLCLLNLYQGLTVRREDAVSRGVLLLDLTASQDGASAQRRLAATDLERFQPFTLALFEPGAGPLVVRWNGQVCAIQSDAARAFPLVSSSYDHRGVLVARRSWSRDLSIDTDPRESLAAFHHSHHPEPGPYSVCMHREGARTVSYTTVSVRERNLEMVYQPGSPCEERPLHKVVMDWKGWVRTTQVVRRRA